MVTWSPVVHCCKISAVWVLIMIVLIGSIDLKHNAITAESYQYYHNILLDFLHQHHPSNILGMELVPLKFTDYCNF